VVKPAREWDEAYLLNLPAGEFNWLEVKGRKALDLTVETVLETAVKENLSKAISALANSGGGQLIFGLSDPVRGVYHVDDGGVDLRVKGRSTREWLEDIITVSVDPQPLRFNVYVVTSGASTSEIGAGRGVFIVDIPDSEQAPHQASDNRYYARVAGKSRPIGYRMVLDIMGRRRAPDLRCTFELISPKGQLRPLGAGVYLDELHVQLWVENHAPEPAHFARISVFIDTRLHVRMLTPVLRPGPSLQTAQRGLQVQSWFLYWNVTDRIPLFQGTPLPLLDGTTIPLRFPTSELGKVTDFLLGWKVEAPGMAQARTGSAALRLDKDTFSIEHIEFPSTLF
jgi:hypothetical protein